MRGRALIVVADMRAVGFYTSGGPEVLHVIELPEPSLGPDEIRIRVHSATVNPTDTARRSRAPTGDRDASPEPQVPGMDAAGVIEEIGAEVTSDLAVGDEVMAVVVPSGTHGAYAEQITVPAESVVRTPHGTGLIEAATLPMNGLTARLALDTLGLKPGQVVAITGAAGSMGGYAVELARADGLTVVADAADADRELVTSLGADIVLSRGSEFAEQVRAQFPDGADGVIDGALMLEDVVAAVRDGATVITLRGYDEPADRGVTFQPVWVVDYARAPEKLDALRQQAEDGTVTLRVADTFSPEQAPEAHRRLEAGGVRGRLVITF